MESMEKLALSSINVDNDSPRNVIPLPSPQPDSPAQSPFQKLHCESSFIRKEGQNEAEKVFDNLLLNPVASNLFLSFASGTIFYNDFLFVLNVLDIEGKKINGAHENKNSVAASILDIFLKNTGSFQFL